MGLNRSKYVGFDTPDLPYLSILDEKLTEDEAFLADYFHYNHTDQIVNEGLDRIKKADDNLDARSAKFAFIAGYASHVIVDGVFHPFVRDKVGDYNAGNQSKHRILEMQIDVFLMKHLYGLELNTSGIQDTLTQHKSLRYHKQAIELFYELIKHAYDREPNYIEKRGQISISRIEMWIQAMHKSLNFAEGEFPHFYRKVMSNFGVAYSELKDIESKSEVILNLGKPVDASIHNLTDNFLQQNKTINFFDDVYPTCLRRVSTYWAEAFDYVFRDKAKPVFPAINLDNGRLLSQSQLTEIPYYWRS